jgi:DNA-binding beta-propeller fold protein YncE
MSPSPLNAGERKYDPSTLVFPPFGHTLGFHKAREIHLKIFLGSDHSFERPTGISAVKLKSKDNPKKSGDDDELTIFGLNSKRGQIMYNSSMLSASTYGERGSGPGEFLEPIDIVADTEGHVFVADTGNNRVVHLIYNSKKNFLEPVGNVQLPSRISQLKAPSGVDVDYSGNLYIADRDNNRIICTDYSGNVKSEISEIQQGKSLLLPTAIAVTDKNDKWLYYKRSFLFVIDANGQRLFKLSPSGQQLAEITAEDIPFKNATFRDIAVDFYTNVYVTDTRNCCVYKFDRKLNFITKFGRCGNKDKELISPWGISIWKRFGQVFITESVGAQYFWIGVDFKEDVEVFETSEYKDKKISKIRVPLTEPAYLTLKIENSNKEVVWDRFKNEKCNRFENIIPWERVDNESKPVPPGIYTLTVEARATYSSKKYFSIQTIKSIEIK